MVSWVRCGTRLYRFLIFAAVLTFIKSHRHCEIFIEKINKVIEFMLLLVVVVMGEGCGGGFISPFILSQAVNSMHI